MSNYVFWFTGLSGSGKSTLASEINKTIPCNFQLFDGDIVRKNLWHDLGFSEKDRKENVRRVAQVAKLFVEKGLPCLCAFITPYESHRAMLREILGEKYVEIYVKCSVETCMKRDTKGLYSLARENKIQNFTGVNDVYEAPATPDLIIDTESTPIYESVNMCRDFITRLM